MKRIFGFEIFRETFHGRHLRNDGFKNANFEDVYK